MAHDNDIIKNKIVTKIVENSDIKNGFKLLINSLRKIQPSDVNAVASIFEAFTLFLNVLSNVCIENDASLEEQFAFAADDYFDLMKSLWKNFENHPDNDLSDDNKKSIVLMLSMIRDYFSVLYQQKSFALLSPYNALISNLFLALPRYVTQEANLDFSKQLLNATRELIKNLQLQAATVKLNEITKSTDSSNNSVLVTLIEKLKELLPARPESQPDARIESQLYEIIDDLYAYQFQSDGIALGRLIKKLIDIPSLTKIGDSFNADEHIKKNIKNIFNKKLTYTSERATRIFNGKNQTRNALRDIKSIFSLNEELGEVFLSGNNVLDACYFFTLLEKINEYIINGDQRCLNNVKSAVGQIEDNSMKKRISNAVNNLERIPKQYIELDMTFPKQEPEINKFLIFLFNTYPEKRFFAKDCSYYIEYDQELYSIVLNQNIESQPNKNKNKATWYLSNNDILFQGTSGTFYAINSRLVVNSDSDTKKALSIEKWTSNFKNRKLIKRCKNYRSGIDLNKNEFEISQLVGLSNKNHELVVTNEEKGVQEGDPWIHVSLIQYEKLGIQLSDHLNKNRFSASDIRTLFLSVLTTYKTSVFPYKILHRDLKPENILYDEGDKKIYIVDYGSSIKLPASAHMKKIEGEVLGTPAFMPPESLSNNNNNPYTHPSFDIYSLGKVLTWMILSATRSINDNDNDNDNAMIYNFEPIIKTGGNREFHAMIDVISQMCDKNPEKRPTLEKVEFLFAIIESRAIIEQSNENEKKDLANLALGSIIASVNDQKSNITPAEGIRAASAIANTLKTSGLASALELDMATQPFLKKKSKANIIAASAILTLAAMVCFGIVTLTLASAITGVGIAVIPAAIAITTKVGAVAISGISGSLGIGILTGSAKLAKCAAERTHAPKLSEENASINKQDKTSVNLSRFFNATASEFFKATDKKATCKLISVCKYV